MAKVHDFLGLWQGSQNLRATQKKSRPQNKQMTAVGYISDNEEIITVSWSNFHHDGAAAFILTERSPVPPALSAMDLPGRRMQVFNVYQFQWINRHPAESDEDSALESISDTENWLDWNGDLANHNDNKDNREAENQSEIELENGTRNSENPSSSRMGVPLRMFPDWFGKHGWQRKGLIWCWWRLVQSKRGGIRGSSKVRLT